MPSQLKRSNNRRGSGNIAYSFAHALTQQAAYHLFMPSQRAQLHALALAALEKSGRPLASARELALHARLAQGGHARPGALLAKERRYLREAARDAERHSELAASAEFWQRLVQIEVPESNRQLDALLGLSKASKETGRLMAAKAAAQKARRVARGLKNITQQANAELMLGQVAFSMSRYVLAQRHARASEALARKARSRKLQGIAVNMLGVMLHQRGRLHEAMRTLKRAETLLAGARAARGVMLARLNRALILNDLGELRQAHSILVACRQTAMQSSDTRVLSTVLANLGITFRKQGRLEEARDCYARALEIARQVGYRERISADLCNLANLEFTLERHELGRSLMQEAIEIAQEVGDIASLSLFSLNLAPYYERKGELHEVQRLIAQALELARKSGNPLYEGSALSRLAALNIRRLNYLEAVNCASQSIAIFEEIGMGDSQEATTALAQKAIALSRLNRPDDALSTREQARTRRRGYALMKHDPDRDVQNLVIELEALPSPQAG